MADAICLDLTTLWLHRGSRPTGILRVEREMARYLRRSRPDACFVVFDRRAGWPRVAPGEVVDALLAGRTGEAPVATRPPRSIGGSLRDLGGNARTRALRVAERFKEPLLSAARGLHLEERARAAVRNIDADRDGPATDWDRLDPASLGLYLFLGVGWERPVFPWLSLQKRMLPALRVAAMVYDLIPVVRPELCHPGVVEMFPRHLRELLDAADIVLCISRATEDDLLRVACERGWAAPATAVVQLGDEPPGGERTTPRQLRDAPIDRFVLMVGTIEPRKNHDFAYRLWRQLAEEHGELAVPLLWVGARGWSTTDLLARVAADPLVAPHLIRVLDDVSDAELNWLYERALFTIFPSHYEGWGLPIRESLAQGKVCLAGGGSSLEEAGAGVALHLRPFDQEAWLAEVVRLLGDDEYRKRNESLIASGYRPRGWGAACEEVVGMAEGAEARVASHAGIVTTRGRLKPPPDRRRAGGR